MCVSMCVCVWMYAYVCLDISGDDLGSFCTVKELGSIHSRQDRGWLHRQEPPRGGILCVLFDWTTTSTSVTEER
jgi:hypothetical protein